MYYCSSEFIIAKRKRTEDHNLAKKMLQRLQQAVADIKLQEEVFVVACRQLPPAVACCNYASQAYTDIINTYDLKNLTGSIDFNVLTFRCSAEYYKLQQSSKQVNEF